MKILRPSPLLLSFYLSGCYTQLATRGDYARSQATPAYGQEVPPADSLAGDSTLAAVPAAADTLAPPAGAPTVIVHNYYDPYPYHRGYAQWEWEYPLLSVGYYSSHYGRYSRPYWWDDPWYSRRHIHHRSHGHPPVYVPARPAAPAGPYRSGQRLFNPEPAYPPVRKGRRSEAPVSAPAEAAPAQKQGTPSGSGAEAEASGSSGSGQAAEAKPQAREEKPAKEPRSLQ